MKFQLTAPCHFGLESVLSSEVRRMGAEDVRVSDGRVTFCGDEALLARANIGLRTAERVQILLGEFDAYSFEDLFQGVKKIPLEDYIGPKDAFPVKGYSLNSQLHSIPDCQKIVKKAMVNRLGAAYNISWFEETGSIHQIEFGIHKNHCLIMLDTSGAGLHKRGYRQTSVIAPMKETLAAGIIDLARVYPDSTLYDPFCGSGTMLIEGAMHAMKIAPGLRRHFTAEKWNLIPQKIWQEERQRAFDLIDRSATFEAYGSDIDPEAVELTKANAQKAGVAARIHVEQRDVKDFAMKEGKGVLICNPPYGERLLDMKEAQKIYRTMGKVFVPREKDRFYIISPDEKFEVYFGRKADKRRKLYNGMIKCQLFSYQK
ncbi:MAG: class I SAM-dependent RNA methyltransferase [Oscillospiraceae bacterium]|nr:class I SAM-dependent RNA methyltransferase [Oscillospiraceae bacterium]